MDSINQSECDNCHIELEGEYCHRCGQRKINFKEDWHGVFHESLSSLFHFDGKILHGLFDIAFCPGHLAKRFLHGKRVSHIPPLRAYLFISLLFFFTVGISDSINQSGGDFDELNELSITSQEDVEEDYDPIEVWVREKIKHKKDIIGSFKSLLPKAFLFGVFVLALIFRFLMRRSGYMYIEHLVSALYLQSFYLLFITLMNGWTGLFEFLSPVVADYAGKVCVIWMLVCPVLAIRKIFDFSYIKAVFVFLMVGFFYFNYLIFSLVIIAVLALLLC